MCNRISDNFIAIDTEYHTNSIGQIDNVYCVCTSDNKGNHFKKWTANQHDAEILDEIAKFHGIENPVYLCHAFDKAERRAFKFLGVDNSKYQWICTWHTAKMLKNSFSKKSERLNTKKAIHETDTERIEEAIAVKLAIAKSLSYAALCKSLLEVDIDTGHKEAMRKLCIENTTEGNEQQIMDYCADDTKYLIPLLGILSKQYYKRLQNSYCPLEPGKFNGLKFDGCFKYLIQQTSYINMFGNIADRGIRLSPDRVQLVKANALRYREQMKADFNSKYPGCFVKGKDDLLHEDTVTLQAYLRKLIDTQGIKDYPVTNSGKLSLSSSTLKDYFKDQNNFGEHYRQLNKLTRLLNGVSKQTDSPFNYIVNENLWYESLQPYGTITSRCTPSTKRFIFGWHKSLYGLIEPAQGRCYVELDFGSEETFIQCCICQDSIYNEIYNSKDIYLAFANKMRLIPNNDWNRLSKAELKTKYKDVRTRIKSLVLGLSYGMGSKRLAHSLGITQMLAECYTEMFSQILHKSTSFKQLLLPKLNRCNAFSLPDGFICSSATNKSNNNPTTVGNFPFQSAGGTILRELVRVLNTIIARDNLDCKLVATIHDAIFFEVKEGDTDTINRVSEIMRKVANKVLKAPAGWSIKVGSPDVIHNGEIWTPEGAFTDQFKQLLNYNED